MSRLNALNIYWEDHPPLHILAAAYMGIKPKEKSDHADLAACLMGAIK